ncbi:anhydro-N-acetylmuramic acid kinase [Pedobacter sp. HMF7647]|uniref:Anhydro-N-acetylmuramic acid kinase n=1 Tax=Hufsiella arboris TaxID=2695275 RepID=A0A7K1Y4N1_9SPHI|nr:anhydro-N-acetylmuramic acid kinase [Hufsiella arboris]MXV49533.1 anhydro-N-acetylmuramic acid kinase [Hufsiella arboris]
MAKSDIDRLYKILQKPERLIVGLMSGTSLDGLDIALCRIANNGIQTEASVLKFESVSYDEPFKKEIRKIFAKKEGSIEELCLLNAEIGIIHADLVLKTLTKWSFPKENVDLIASHGQTIFHSPKRLHQLKDYPDATLQIGDGDHVAYRTGIITVSDFRQKHVAAGGEGAPLAHIGDYLLFSSVDENRVMLNIGGISNFTFLPKNGDVNKVVSTDCGPGNTLIDALTRRDFNVAFDRDAKLALSGKLVDALLEKMLAHPFFTENPPKTTGPELFNISFIEESLRKFNQPVSSLDLLATVTMLSARSIADAIKKICKEGAVYVSGGGASNPLIMDSLRKLLPGLAVSNLSSLGYNADAKEALLFAILANEAVAGESFSSTIPTMGKISFPA